MSKYRCPVCGATHKEEPRVCRLCGYRMTENMGTLVTSETGTKPIIKTKSGFGRPMLFALAGVILLVAAAVGLGFVEADDGDTVTQLRAQVPVLKSDTPDGWSTISDDAGGFTVQFPTTNEPATRPLADADGGEIVGVGASAGETELFVGSGEVTPSDDDLDERLMAYAEELMGVPEDKFDADTKTTIVGLRALQVQEEKQVEPGIYRTFNTLLFLNGDRLYVIESTSKEDPAATTTDPPDEFSRVAGTFVLSGTSTAS